MSDVALTVEREIAAPADAVWHVLTDVEGAPTVLSRVTAVERLAGSGYTIGTRWRETRATGTRELEVVGIDPGRSTMLEAEAAGSRSRIEFTLEPAGAATTLRMRCSGTFETPSWVQRAAAWLTWRLERSATRTSMQQDLDDIAAAAEPSTR